MPHTKRIQLEQHLKKYDNSIYARGIKKSPYTHIPYVLYQMNMGNRKVIDNNSNKFLMFQTKKRRRRRVE